MTHKGEAMEDVLMTPLAVSLDMKLSVGAIRNYALTGKLPFIATTTGRRLFKKKEVEKLKAKLIAAARAS